MKRKINNKIKSFFRDKKFNEVLNGSIWAIVGRIVGAIIGFVLSILIARLYGPKSLGNLAMINSFLGLTTLITIFGTNTSILRLIPEHIVKYSVSSAFKVFLSIEKMVVFISIVIGTICYFCAGYIAESIFLKPDLEIFLQLASIFIVFRSLMDLNIQTIRGLKLMRVYSIFQFLPKTIGLVFLLISGMIVVDENLPVYALLCEFLLISILGFVIIYVQFNKRINILDKILIVPVKKVLSISLPMMMADTSYYVMGYSGVVILGIFRTTEEIGFYSLAVSISVLTSFSIKAINSVAASKFSELFHSGKIDEMFYVAKKSAKLIFWTTVPILLFLLLFGKTFITIFYGEDFTIVYLAVVMMLVGQFVNAASGATSYLMNMTGLHKVFQNIMLITSLLNVLLNILLIPNYGINGAAFSLMFSQVFWNIITLYVTHKKFNKNSGYLPFLSRKNNNYD